MACEGAAARTITIQQPLFRIRARRCVDVEVAIMGVSLLTDSAGESRKSRVVASAASEKSVTDWGVDNKNRHLHHAVSGNRTQVLIVQCEYSDNRHEKDPRLNGETM